MKLKLPETFYDLRQTLKPQGRKQGFETLSKVRIEDKFRIKSLRQYRKSSRVISRKRDDLLNKAKRVELQIASKAPTLASSRHMRSRRLRWIGAVLKLAASKKSNNLKLFTLVPNRGWCVQGDDLASVSPKRLLARFRQQLVRLGIGGSGGWCIVYLHGEYDPTLDTYQLHVHALASGNAIVVMSKLRLLPMYRRAIAGAQVRVKRPSWKQRWKDPARQASYLAQGFWPSKSTDDLGTGKTSRKRRRRRIPMPRFAEYLIWLDRHSFQDFVLLFGCKVSGGQLVSTRKRHRGPRS